MGRGKNWSLQPETTFRFYLFLRDPLCVCVGRGRAVPSLCFNSHFPSVAVEIYCIDCYLSFTP